MKRKLMLAGLVIVCAMLLCACSSSGPKATSAEFFTWVVNVDGNAVLTGYTGNEQLVIIPSKLGGKKVVEIGDSAFSKNKVPVKVVVPEGVTAIGDSAFRNCDNLESVTLPDTVTRIEMEAFCSADKLSFIDLSDNLEYIGERAFASCVSLKRHIILPESMTRMGDNAFQDSGITGVSIFSDIEHERAINPYAGWFGGCNNLKSVYFKDGVTTVDFRDFRGENDSRTGKYEIMTIDSMTIPASVTTFYRWNGVVVRDVTNAGGLLFNCRINHVYAEEGSAAHTLFTQAMEDRFSNFCDFHKGDKITDEPFTGAIN